MTKYSTRRQLKETNEQQRRRTERDKKKRQGRQDRTGSSTATQSTLPEFAVKVKVNNGKCIKLYHWNVSYHEHAHAC